MKRKAKENLEIAWKLLNSPDWRVDKESQTGDTIYSKQIPHIGKVFKLKVVARVIFDSEKSFSDRKKFLLLSDGDKFVS